MTRLQSHQDRCARRQSSKRQLAASLLIFALVVCLAPGEVAEGQSRVVSESLTATSLSPVEAPTGFDTETNGMVDQSTHEADMEVFEEQEEVDEGLGPIFNARGCADCHSNPVVGAISQVTELRVGKRDRFGRFENPHIPIGDGSIVVRGRSLINDRSVCPNGMFPDVEVQQRVPDDATVRTFRTSLNTLGDGFVESLPSSTILKIAQDQCRRTGGVICGLAIQVPVAEAPGIFRVGRFGWKNQHASLVSFSGDAYLNEMGITNVLFPQEIFPTPCDTVADPEDTVDPATGLSDVDLFARFMRATKAPARDANLAATFDARIGSDLFDRIGCDMCHVPNLVTAPAGSVLNGGTFTVPPALGNKRFHPYSDFLLHNVGTGDGIVQNGGQGSANRLRTPPLWGVRMRSRLMHDGGSLTFDDAIQRHGGEAGFVRRNYNNLSDTEKKYIATFLRSL
jgi:CxxC motif-containing protein (DUF1111 family)